MNNDMRKNGSGCSDPTAYAAIKKVDQLGRNKKRDREKDVSDAMHLVKRLLDIVDFELEGRLTLIDKQTGKKYF